MPPIDDHVQGRGSHNPTGVDSLAPAGRPGPEADARQLPDNHGPQVRSLSREDAFLVGRPSGPRAAGLGTAPVAPQPQPSRDPGDRAVHGGSTFPANRHPTIGRAERRANSGGPPHVPSDLYRRVRDRTHQVVRVFARRGAHAEPGDQEGRATNSSARSFSVSALWARYRSFRAVVLAREQMLMNASGELSLRRVSNFMQDQMSYLNSQHGNLDTLREFEATASAIYDWHANSRQQSATVGVHRAAFVLLNAHLSRLREQLGPAQEAAAEEARRLVSRDQFKQWAYSTLREDQAPELGADMTCPLSLMTLDDPAMQPVFFPRGDATALADFTALQSWFNLHGACDPIAAGGAAPLAITTLYRPEKVEQTKAEAPPSTPGLPPPHGDTHD